MKLYKITMDSPVTDTIYKYELTDSNVLSEKAKEKIKLYGVWNQDMYNIFIDINNKLTREIISKNILKILNRDSKLEKLI